MKKMMIVAAVAAMAGGAFALDGYDFTATLKTTQGKVQAAKVTTYNLGMDSSGAFWYNDTSVDTNGTYAAITNKAPHTLPNGTVVPGLAKDSKGFLLNPTTNDIALVKKLAAIYKFRSAGQWCETIKISEQGCYRVAGSAKIDVKLYTTNCCAIATADVFLTNNVTVARTENSIVLQWGIPTPDIPTGTTANPPTVGYGVQSNVVVNYGIDLWMVNRFGALTYDKATKVEILGDIWAPTTADGRWLDGTLAGQGTYSAGRVNTVSGNIVGEIDPPVCPNCCTDPSPAVAFDCDDPDPDFYLTSAAFGTFRLKYNNKL